jgi:DNA-binding transcriptional LysR family regulator
MAELRHYRYFLEIARRGSFTAASEALNITQSALSEQILQFERMCGSTLFTRGHSGVTLTPAGEFLLPRAEALLGQAAETWEGLALFRHGYQERLRLASVLGPLQSWLPTALAEFVGAQPHVQLHVQYIHSVNEILTELAGGQLDIGVVSLRPSSGIGARGDSLTQTVILEEDMVLLAPEEHPLAQLAHVTPSDLRSTPLITFPTGFYLRQTIEDWTRRGGYVPVVAAETGTMELILQLIRAGVGVAIVPRSQSRTAKVEGLRVISLDPTDTPRRIVAAVYRPGRGAELLRPLVALMEQHARQAAGVDHPHPGPPPLRGREPGGGEPQAEALAPRSVRRKSKKSMATSAISGSSVSWTAAPPPQPRGPTSSAKR